MPTKIQDIKGMFDKASFTAVIIVYLFICGGLYIVGYWGSFNLDVTPFIGITDVPKSFFLPFNASNSIIILLIMGVVVLLLTKLLRWLKGFFKWLFIFVSTIALIIYCIVSDTYWNYIDVENLNFGIVLTVLFICSVILAEFFTNNNINLFSKYVIILAVSLPAFCFLSGTDKAEDVKRCLDCFQVEVIKTGDSSLRTINGTKLVGYVGDKVILTRPMINKQEIKDTFFIIDQKELAALRLKPLR